MLQRRLFKLPPSLKRSYQNLTASINATSLFLEGRINPLASFLDIPLSRYHLFYCQISRVIVLESQLFYVLRWLFCVFVLYMCIIVELLSSALDSYGVQSCYTRIYC